MSATQIVPEENLAEPDRLGAAACVDSDPSVAPTNVGFENAWATPSLAFSPDEFIDDDSWAKPRPKGNRRLHVAATALAITLLCTGAFVLGAKLHARSTSTSTPGGLAGLGRAGLGGFGGAGGLGGAGGFGGFGGAGGFGGRNRAAGWFDREPLGGLQNFPGDGAAAQI